MIKGYDLLLSVNADEGVHSVTALKKNKPPGHFPGGSQKSDKLPVYPSKPEDLTVFTE